jgi:anti-sigma factor RsiW
MSCTDWTTKLDTYLDGELDGQEIALMEAHLRECPSCATESVRRSQWKRAVRFAGQRYVADHALRERVQKQISSKSVGHLPMAWRWRAAYLVPLAALVLLAGALVVNQNVRRTRNQQIVGELADLHVATLASNTPVDVVSTDRHTVKPWFEGKIPFTFNVPELNGSPYELVGGRVSYLEQSPGAELVFRLRKHQISAFIFQERAVASDFPVAGEMDARSFHLESWKQNGLRYFVIGDVGAGDLRALSELLKKAQ